jgi:hypothetical protein
VFGKENDFRRACYIVGRSRLVSWVVDVAHVSSVAVFCLLTYVDYEKGEDVLRMAEWLGTAQLVINVVFSFEVALKSVALGLWIDEGSYCTVSCGEDRVGGTSWAVLVETR